MKLLYKTTTTAAISIIATYNLFGIPAVAADLLVRKNVVDLTSEEKAAFVNAVLTLKNTFTSGSEISVYDQFVATHLGAMGLMEGMGGKGPAAGFDAAHGYDGFLPWHREFLGDFETALQSVDPNTTIPYWDWTDPNALNVMFQNDFLGLNGQGGDITIPDLGIFRGGTVQSGYFSEANGWILNPSLNININIETEQSKGTSLSRYILSPGSDQYPIPQETQDSLLAVDDYGTFRRVIEGFSTLDEQGNEISIPGNGLHNYVHGVIGGGFLDFSTNPPTPTPLGTMANVPSSPYDPVFWLLHANVDRLWAQWQVNGHWGSNFYPSEGETESNLGQPEDAYGHSLKDLMWPWDGGQSIPGSIGGNLLSLLPSFAPNDIVTPEDTLDFRQYGYTYDTISASAPASVPEPTSTLGLFSLSVFGAGLLVKHKRKQKALVCYSHTAHSQKLNSVRTS
jgi:tyrosinase